MWKSIKKYLAWFWRAIRPYKGSVGLMLFCHLLLTVSSLAFIIFTKELIDEVLPSTRVVTEVVTPAPEATTEAAPEAIAPSTAPSASQVIAQTASHAIVPSASQTATETAAPTVGWTRAATVMAIILIVITFLRVGLNASSAYLQSRTAIKLKNHMRQRLFDALLRQQIDGSKPRHSADVISRLQEDVRVLASAFSTSVPGLIGTGIQFIAAFGYLLYLDARLAWVLIVILPLGLVASRFVSRKIRNLTLDIRESDTEVQSHLQENVQHLTLLKSMEYVGRSAATLGDLQSNLYDREMRRTRFSITAKAILSLAFSGGYILVFLWGVNGLVTGAITYGIMMAFMQLVGQVQRPLLDASAYIPAILHSTASIDRLMDIEMLPKEEGTDRPFKVDRAGIRFDKVTFAYPEYTAATGTAAARGTGHQEMKRANAVVKAFSHDFQPGTKTAIIGHTGVGKSTLIRLMLALLRPCDGHLYLYGTDAKGKPVEKEISPATRCNLVYVPQGNSLFSGTIRDNLLMGNPEATDEEMKHVLGIASAEFVLDLPQGLDTPCSELGGGFSEGQAQRIAIARALLRPGSILLLDEFSSALDNETENLMLGRLTAELPEKTMIFITHREKIIDYCDNVLRLG